jgi:hypothetical protein
MGVFEMEPLQKVHSQSRKVLQKQLIKVLSQLSEAVIPRLQFNSPDLVNALAMFPPEVVPR